ncbi:MAG: Ppx/GppA phosphatase family protein [Endozoicomonas sp. (ex Botrylloides leachii)]|nr:Ppx/GppA phosphatase family protein [Endozoicomonas sp. (ex Botrylloides leachii)]
MVDKNRNEVECQSLVAAIDLGSNSFHMVVASIEQNEIRPLHRLGRKVQLAAGLSKDNTISDEAMRRGLDCLEQFGQYLAEKKFRSVRIVGTNTLRNAKNRQFFLEKAQEVVPYPVEVIAGREEARLIYLGIAQTQGDDADRRLALDIGGGSTEFIIGEKFEPILLESLQMGCVTFTERYFNNGKITPERFQSAFYAAKLELLNIAKPYSKLGWIDAVGSSGSIKAISHVLQALTGSQTITLTGLNMLKNKMLHFQDLKALQIPGLRPDRHTIFPGGLAILLASFDTLAIKQARFSEGALREGILYDMLGRSQYEDVKERTIDALLSRYNVNQDDAIKRSKHALNCFEQTQKDWKLGIPDDQRLLTWAARICKIGIYISHTQFHHHGAYLINHCDFLGFSSEERQSIAFLVVGHYRSIPKAELESLPRHRQSTLLKLAILLRIACLLNSVSMQVAEITYSLKAQGNKLSILFPEGWLDEHPLTRAELSKERGYLSKVGFTLVIN